MSGVEIDIESIGRPAHRKLMSGGAIRVKAPSSGNSMKVTLHPIVAKKVMSAFKKGKASTITGEGIFGTPMDILLKKAGVKKKAYAVGDKVRKPLAAATVTGILAGATMLGAAQPELAPYLSVAAPILARSAGKYIESPSSFGVYAKGYSGKRINPLIGTAQQIGMATIEEQIKPTKPLDFSKAVAEEEAMTGTGFGGRGKMYEKSSLSNKLIGNAALKSQPMGVNFQWNNTLGRGLY